MANEEVVYVTSPFSEKAYTPILPPYDDEMKHVSSSFPGRPVLIEKNQEMDLGDIPMQIQYGLMSGRSRARWRTRDGARVPPRV